MANFFSPIGNGVAFVDSNGNPLSGALLFTYLAGSTTKKTTYKDSAGAASHTNPIVLDANGRPPNPIWLIGSSVYKFVLAPSTDTDPPTSAIYTWDNIPGINDTTASGQDQWVSGPTPTFVDANTFTLVGDQTSNFHVGRRVKLTVSAGTVYGYISVSAFTTLTTIDVVLDSGALDSGLSAVSYALLSSTNQSFPNRVATTDTAQTISGAKTFTAQQIFESTDAGAAAGPTIPLDRNSASPAASDVLGAIPFNGRDSGAGTDTYAQIQAEIVDPTATSEDGELAFLTAVAGALAKRGFIRNGLVWGSPTGGDMGAGVINAVDYARNGISAIPTVRRKTVDESVTSSTTLQNDDHLTFAVAANEEWVVDYNLSVGDSIDTTGLLLAIVVPAGAVFRATFSGVGDVLGDTDSGRSEVSGAAPANLFLAAQFTSLTMQVHVKVYVLNGGTAGSITLQFAQETSIATAVTIRRGSYLVAHRIA